MNKRLEGQPKVTIIIPTFNNLKNMRGCIENVKLVLGADLGKNVLLHIQDGESTDGTYDFLNQLRSPHISYGVESDRGVYDAMNRAINKVVTDWVFFLGGDDRLLPGFVSAIKELHGPNIYYANVRFASDNRRYDGRFTPRKLVFRNICHQAMFFPTSALKVRPYSLDYPINSDWAHNIILMRYYPFKYLAIDVARFTDTGGLSSTKNDIAFDTDKGRLFLENHGYFEFFLCRSAPLLTNLFRLAKKLARYFKLHLQRTSRKYNTKK